MSNLPVPSPLQKRPSLGSRFFIRGHIRRLWTPLYKEIKDINKEHRIRAAKLMLYGLVFTENYLTQFLDKMIPQLLTSLIPHDLEDKNVSIVVETMFKLIGRYCSQSSYLHIIGSSLKGQLVSNEQYIQASLKALNLLLEGSFQCMCQDGLGQKKDQVCELLNLLQQIDLPSEIYHSNSFEAESTAEIFINLLTEKASSKERYSIMNEYFLFLLKLYCNAIYEQQYFSCFNLVAIDTQKCDLEKIQRPIKKLLNLHPQGIEFLQEYLSVQYQDPPKTLDSHWKNIFIIFHTLITSPSPHERTLATLSSEAICECIKTQESIQLVTFLFRVIKHILSGLSPCYFQKISSLLLCSMQSFLKYKSKKKVPIYDEHLVPADNYPANLKINDKIYYELFKCCSQAFRNIYLFGGSLLPNILAQIIDIYLQILKKNQKNSLIQTDGVKTLWSIFQKSELSHKLALNLCNNGEYVLPEVIQFAVGRLEKLEGAQRYQPGMVFSLLQCVVSCTPITTAQLPIIPQISKSYPEILERMFKYTLDEKDPQLKIKYIDFLKKLYTKIPKWYEHELRIATQSRRLLKAELIKEIMN